MAEEKIIVGLEFPGLQAAEDQLTKVNLQLKEMKKNLKGIDDEDAYLKQQREINALAAEKSKLNRIVKEERNLQDAAAGSYRELNARLVKARRQYKELSAEQRNNEKVGGQLLRNIEMLDRELKDLDKTMGQFQRNVGNYPDIQNRIGVGFRQMAQAASAYLAVASAGELFQGFVRQTQALSELQAILGVTGEEYEKLTEIVNELTVITLDNGEVMVNTSEDIAGALQLVGSKAPQLLQNQDALAAVTQEALVLAKAMGGNLDQAANTLTATMNQFGLSAEDSTRIINALAAGSQKGSATVQDIGSSMDKFGTIAASQNITVEESVALIETLAEKNITAEKAGTGLRNVLLKLQASADKNLNPALVGVDTALENLAAKNLTAAELTQMFGLENVVVAQILAENTDRFAHYSEAVSNTNTAYEQAATNSDNLSTDLENLRNTLQNTANEILSSGEGAIRKFIQFLTDGIPVLADNIELLGKIATVSLLLAKRQAISNGAIKVANALSLARTKIMTGLSGAMAAVAKGQLSVNTGLKSFKTLFSASGLGTLVTVVTAAAFAFDELFSGQTKVQKRQEELNEITKDLTSQIRQEITASNQLFDVLRDENATREQQAEALDKINQEYDNILENYDLEQTDLKLIAEAQREVNAAILEGIVARAQAAEANRLIEEQIQVQRELSKAQREYNVDLSQEGVNLEEIDRLRGQVSSKELVRINKLFKQREELQKQLGGLDEEFAGIQQDLTSALEDIDLGVLTPEGDDGGAGTNSAGPLNKTLTTLESLRDALEEARGEFDKYEDLSDVPKEVFDRLDSAEKAYYDFLARIEKARRESFLRGLDPADALESIGAPDLGELDDDLQIQYEEERQAELLRILEASNMAKEQANAEFIERTNEQFEQQMQERREREQEFLMVGLDALGQLSDAFFDSRRQGMEEDFNRMYGRLEEEERAAIAAAEARGEDISKVQEDFAKKREELDKQRFQREKSIALQEAFIQLALSLIEAAPNPFAIASTAALGAVQIGIIAATQYKGEKGMSFFGGAKEGRAVGPRHATGGINLGFAEIEGGEEVQRGEDGRMYVLNRAASTRYASALSSMRGKTFFGKAGLLSAMNMSTGGVPLMQQGGVIGGPPAGLNVSAGIMGPQRETQMLVDEQQRQSAILVELVKAMRQQKIVLAVSDVNTVNSDSAQVQAVSGLS